VLFCREREKLEVRTGRLAWTEHEVAGRLQRVMEDAQELLCKTGPR